MKQKKIINDPRNVVDELLDGMVLAYDGKIRRLENHDVLVKNDIPDGKVALLIGGGSGHEPLYHGGIGENMGDGAACGNIFAAPSPEVVYEATKAVHRGKGVLYLYGNYAGDNMNFDMGAELAEEEGIETRTVRIWDDVASAPPDQAHERRGIAGCALIVKIAGAAAATVDNLAELERITTKARDNTRSMGVAVRAGSIPETGAPTFELPDDEIEIGMGVHGEPGVKRQKLPTADPLAEEMINLIVDDMPFGPGDEVVLSYNNLGATTMMEILIANRIVRRVLEEKGIVVYSTEIGAYITCQEMSGFSITLVKLDDELKKYYDMPADSLAYKRVGK